jgi:hypothetical protein
MAVKMMRIHRFAVFCDDKPFAHNDAFIHGGTRVMLLWSLFYGLK